MREPLDSTSFPVIFCTMGRKKGRQARMIPSNGSRIVKKNSVEVEYVRSSDTIALIRVIRKMVITQILWGVIL